MKDFLEVVRFCVVLGVLLFVVLGMAIMGCLDGTPPPVEQQPFPVKPVAVVEPAEEKPAEPVVEVAEKPAEPELAEEPSVPWSEFFRQARQTRQAQQVQEQQTAIVVSPDYLLEVYDKNEVRGDAKYKGNLLEVTGEIDRIGRDIGNTAYLTFKIEKFTFRGVQCMMSKANEHKLANVDVGDTVTVRGTGAGMFGNVLLRHCVLAE